MDSIVLTTAIAAGSLALASFLSIATWVSERRREREAFYRSEVLKKAAETPGPGGAAALELMRAQDQAAERHRIESLKVGGLVCAALGIAGGVLFIVAPNAHKGFYFLVGIITFAIGAALLLYVYGLAKQISPPTR